MSTDPPAFPVPGDERELLALLHALGASGYRHVTSTPATHARVVARPERARARSIEDALGWSLPFGPGVLPMEIERRLGEAHMLEAAGDRMRRSRVRVSSRGRRLFLHSAYPTLAEDAVFFGPDSYRFADLIEAELAASPLAAGARIVDIGTGSGIGGIVAADMVETPQVTLTDINAGALRLAAISAAAAGVAAAIVETPGMRGLDGPFDLLLINPPYIIDPAGRAYRDGGGLHGGQLSLDLMREAMERLAPGGRAILYTGSAIVDGKDALGGALDAAADNAGCTLRYREIDPDVFGEELDEPQYREVERIALVAAVAFRPR